jgi:hypothetical protein
VRRQDSGRTPPRTTPDAPSARERKEIAQVHRGIERAQADVRRRARQQTSQPRLAPISAAMAREYASHPHASTAEVRADVVARAALRHLQSDVARSRRASPGPGVSGYRFLASAVGPRLGRASTRHAHSCRAASTCDKARRSPECSLLESVPTRPTHGRTHGQRRAKGEAYAKVLQAARPRPNYWQGPGQRALTRPLLTEVNSQNKVNPVPDYNHDGIGDARDLITYLRRGNRPWQQHHRDKGWPHTRNSVRSKLLASRASRVGGLRVRAGT